MLAANRGQDLVIRRLGVDADTRHTAISKSFQLFGGNAVGTSCFKGKFDVFHIEQAMYFFQKPCNLPLIEHSRRATTDIDAG